MKNISYFCTKFTLYMKHFYDVIIVGAGHAGCEAACASAAIGAKTCLVTIDMNKIAQMSCNPAVGGIAKGQIVREIDALGGRMGIVTDRTAIQFRMLNRSKGPAMWSPRAQCAREQFIWEWRHQLDITPNLDIWQDQVTEILTEKTEHTGDNSNDENAKTRVIGVKTLWGVEIYARAVVITAGTFLNGLLHIGKKMLPGGRIAEPAAAMLTESINSIGIRSERMKTGTPVRIDARSVDFSLMERQDGEDLTHMFSYINYETAEKQYIENTCNAQRDRYAAERLIREKQLLPCWTTTTNAKCHEILLSGLKDSPLYNGQIQSIGPRYCPSVETKLITFADKDSHPLFLEPEGLDTNEMYLNGFSSSMPMEIQLAALREIPAFRNLKIYRPGYAIEYDFFDPTQLKHSLESKICEGLFFAGQVNGTTGYEEAAGQGLVAGTNAALLAGKNTETAEIPALVLNRDQAYIGVLIDDLVMKGVDEPYRMFTSRAEYRILLRQDDADMRLTERAYQIGLVKQDRYDALCRKREAVQGIIEFAKKFSIKAALINDALVKLGTAPLSHGCKLIDLIIRPQITIESIAEYIPSFKAMLDKITDRKEEIIEAAEVLIKYQGYIDRERMIADKIHRLESIRIKGRFDYNSLNSLSTEARQKLIKIDPETLAQASRIPGISPSDINVLLVLLGR